jgi:hypothetical protein
VEYLLMLIKQPNYGQRIRENRMDAQERKVVIELSEHDALRLLTLIQDELKRGDKVWHTYWERLAHHIQQGIERASSGFRRRPIASEDSNEMFG